MNTHTWTHTHMNTHTAHTQHTHSTHTAHTHEHTHTQHTHSTHSTHTAHTHTYTYTAHSTHTWYWIGTGLWSKSRDLNRTKPNQTKPNNVMEEKWMEWMCWTNHRQGIELFESTRWGWMDWFRLVERSCWYRWNWTWNTMGALHNTTQHNTLKHTQGHARPINANTRIWGLMTVGFVVGEKVGNLIQSWHILQRERARQKIGCVCVCVMSLVGDWVWGGIGAYVGRGVTGESVGMGVGVRIVSLGTRAPSHCNLRCGGKTKQQIPYNQCWQDIVQCWNHRLWVVHCMCVCVCVCVVCTVCVCCVHCVCVCVVCTVCVCVCVVCIVCVCVVCTVCVCVCCVHCVCVCVLCALCVCAVCIVCVCVCVILFLTRKLGNSGFPCKILSIDGVNFVPWFSKRFNH